jgi:hypothetical protein
MEGGYDHGMDGIKNQCPVTKTLNNQDTTGKYMDQ